MKRMYSIGLTGGIGSGKSRVADLFGQWGAAIIDTDVIAHSLTAAGGRAIGPIRAAFGEQVIAEDGALDRKAMRRSEEHTSELQSLMRISYAVFCLKKKKETNKTKSTR